MLNPLNFLSKFIKSSNQKELDRIAKIDLVILNLAITEIKDFKLIPVKVSLNEYIEISKD